MVTLRLKDISESFIYTTSINITDYIPESDKEKLKNGPIDCISGKLSVREIVTDKIRISLVSGTVYTNIKLGIESDGRVYVLIDVDNEQFEPGLIDYVDSATEYKTIEAITYDTDRGNNILAKRFPKGTKIYGFSVKWSESTITYKDVTKVCTKLTRLDYVSNLFIQGLHRSLMLHVVSESAVMSSMYICYNRIPDNATETFPELEGSETLVNEARHTKSKYTYSEYENNTGLGVSKVLYIDFNSDDVQQILTGRTGLNYQTWLKEGTIVCNEGPHYSTDGLSIQFVDNLAGINYPPAQYSPFGNDIYGVSLTRSAGMVITAPEGYYITAVGWSGKGGGVSAYTTPKDLTYITLEGKNFDYSVMSTAYKYGDYQVTSLKNTATKFPDVRQGTLLAPTTHGRTTSDTWPITKYSTSSSSSGSDAPTTPENPGGTRSDENLPSVDSSTKTRYKATIETTATNVELTNVIHYVDTNTEGSTIDPTALLYVGGEAIVPKTIAAKDNTLFLGNYLLSRPNLKKLIGNVNSSDVQCRYREFKLPMEKSVNFTGDKVEDEPITILWDDHINDPVGKGYSKKSYYITDNTKVLVGFHETYTSGWVREIATLKAYDANGNEIPNAKFEYKHFEDINLRTNPAKAPVDNRLIVGIKWKDHSKFLGMGDDWGRETIVGYRTAELYCNGTLVTIQYNRQIYKEEIGGFNYSVDIPHHGTWRKQPSHSEVMTAIHFSGKENSGEPITLYTGIMKSSITTKVTKYDISSFYPLDGVLNSHTSAGLSTVSAVPRGFKANDWYRLGVQFQHKSGKWSEPYFISDSKMTLYPKFDDGNISMGEFFSSINTERLRENGYIKVRPVIVQPSLYNRSVLAQGILCPTVTNAEDFEAGAPHYQSSWFTRVVPGLNATKEDDIRGYYPQYKDGAELHTSESNGAEIESNIHTSIVDLSKKFNSIDKLIRNKDRFTVSYKCQTFHSPDVEFNEDLWLLDYSANYKLNVIGNVDITAAAGDIYLSTKSPSLNSKAGGFIHKHTYDPTGGKSLMCGGFYNGGLVNYETKDTMNKFSNATTDSQSVYFKIYPWHSSGSLSNDITRPANSGVLSSELERKIISNIKYASSSNVDAVPKTYDLSNSRIQLFNADQMKLVKVGGFHYYGNVDTLLTTYIPYGVSFYTLTAKSTTSEEFATKQSTLIGGSAISDDRKRGVYTWNDAEFVLNKELTLMDDMYMSKSPIRMKYKSTPHYVVYLGDDGKTPERKEKDSLVLAEITRELPKPYGEADEATLESHTWIPAGDTQLITGDSALVEWKYGDTYYQRYDCLKTYPFTHEDENSIVDIVSFMCETRVNLGGRYDKNRGQNSNLYVTPQNFNLLNPVYNQMDNYFNYKILDEDFYKIDKFDTDVTWSLQKTNTEDVDNFAKTTLASTLSIDGNKGAINALTTWNNHIYAFQDTGISEIMFNSRVQIPVSEGTPIEISNNYKVDGNQYISDNLGCTNKWAIANTPSGVYFVEHRTKELHHLGLQGLMDLSSAHCLSSWFKNHKVDRLWYDTIYNDLYINTDNTNNDGTSLCYSEGTANFSSFMDYQEAKAMFNINGRFLALTNIDNDYDTTLWSLYTNNKHCLIFGKHRDYGFSFLSNADAATTKIFNNMDIRGDWFEVDNNGERFKTEDFFSKIRTTNEYQDSGAVDLVTKRSDINPLPNVQKKFRIWNVVLPRDAKNPTFGSLKNRMTNTWLKISLWKDKKYKDTNRMELHDVNVSYYV